MMMSSKVGYLLDELTRKYIPAYDHLVRAHIHSLERALAFRQAVLAKVEVPPDEQSYAARLSISQEKDREVEQEANAARKLINAIIDDVSTPSDNAALARIETRIENTVTEFRRQLADEDAKLLTLLAAGKVADARSALAHVDVLRDEFTERSEAIRSDLLTQVFSSTSTVIRSQRQAIVNSAIVTALAATLGLGFALFVSSGITRRVRRLLDGTREIEAGRFDQLVGVSTRDEIGQLSAAFNRMVEQLRRNERLRETFGRYIDPKVVEGLIDSPKAATQGKRRVMTVMFCDMKGFTSMSEGMTPQGLVKVMNCYLTTMSAPIREHHGVIDKFIGDAIMAFWGPPFVGEAEQARLACLAAIDMIDRVPELRRQLPELLGVRALPAECDIRIGIATGDVLTGSIGSELMMSFTVMGDTVNLASRLEGVNKVYGSRLLISEATAAMLDDNFELREIDRLTVVGQTAAQSIFEVMGKRGELTKQQELLLTHYSEGLAAYRACHWNDARNSLNSALNLAPADGPSLTLLSRIGILQTDPPPLDWNGVWQMEHK
jgi:class 3 adenylate cyclase